MMKKIVSIIFMVFTFLLAFNPCKAAYEFGDKPHWNKGKISVYIPAKDAKSASMKRAFLAWENASYGKLQFVFKDNGPADIDVVFVEKVNGTDGPLGAYNVSIQNGYITKGEIKIASKSSDIKKYSNNMIYTTMLHEIGHVLGLSHNERKQICIMHSPILESQNITKIDMAKLYKLNGWSWRDK